MRTTSGVPCPHEILEKEANGQYLTVDDFHPQWHLRENIEDEPIDPRLYVQDPLNVRSRCTCNRNSAMLVCTKYVQ